MAELKYCEQCECCYDYQGKREKGAIPTFGKVHKTCKWCKKTLEENGGFEIEKNIPIPEARISVKCPFGKMERGDSFKIPDRKSYVRVSSARTKFTKAHKSKAFTIRREDDHWRCWRLK